MKKKILLINKSGLNAPFEKALREEGFDVTSFFESKFPVFKKNLFQKFYNILRRKIFDDKTYLQRAEKTFIEKQNIKRSRAFKKKFDYALFFRADLYPEEMIKNIRKISGMMVADQYDGMMLCSRILDYRPYFDRLFVFDPDDFRNYKNKGFLPITNCWFQDEDKTSEIKQDFFYVGVGTDDRQQKIKDFQDAVLEKFSLKAILTIPPFRKEQKHEGVYLSHKGLSYDENIEQLKSSKCVIDFKLNHHNGLSFRFFEAMNYEKKIITNNFSVMNYDFYRPENIFICDFDDLSGLEGFMKKPYTKLPESVVQKYSFRNWIKYVLDIGDYQKIGLE